MITRSKQQHLTARIEPGSPGETHRKRAISKELPQLGDTIREVEHFRVKSGAIGASAVGAFAIGAFSVGALAVGFMAIGFMAIQRLAIEKAHVRSLKIDKLDVGQLHVSELVSADRLVTPVK